MLGDCYLDGLDRAHVGCNTYVLIGLVLKVTVVPSTARDAGKAFQAPNALKPKARMPC